MQVHFVRHGESVSNAAPGGMALPAVQGDRLTDLGREQAAAVARYLGGVGATRVLTSPLGRARETAEILGERLGLPVEELDELQELRESEGYEELSLEDQRLRRWSVWMAAHGDDPDYSYRGGETFNEISARVRRAQERLLALGDETVIAVSHGIFLRFFLISVILVDGFGPSQVQRLWQLESVNCGICSFEYRDRDLAANYELDPWTCLSWMERPRARREA
jgi:ribonuclease H / adenosylcobalamin/alpha-ribazole phosphatase